MKIKTKLLWAFATVTLVFLITGVGILFAVSNMNTMNASVTRDAAIFEAASDLERAEMVNKIGLYMYIQGNKDAGLEMVEEAEEIAEEAEETLNELIEDPELLDILNGELEDLEEGLELVTYEMMDLVDSDVANKDELLATRLGDLETGISLLEQHLADFKTITKTNVQNAMTASQEYGVQVFQITAAGIVVALVSSNAIAFLMGNRISKPINQLSQAAHNTSLGNFEDLELENAYSDEIQELSESFNRMLNSFKLMDAMNKGNLGEEINEPRARMH